jgi:hypothetical protein
MVRAWRCCGGAGRAWWHMRVLCRVLSGALAQAVFFFRIRSGGMHRVLPCAKHRLRTRDSGRTGVAGAWQASVQAGPGVPVLHAGRFGLELPGSDRCNRSPPRTSALMCCSNAHRHTGLVCCRGRGAASNSWTGLRDTQTNPPINRCSVNARCCFRALAFTCGSQPHSGGCSTSAPFRTAPGRKP